VTGLDHEGQVRRQSTIVGSASSFVVLVGGGKVVGQLAGTLLDLAFVVRLGVVLVFFGEGLGFVDGEDCADKGAVGDSRERVAGGADFAVNLETSAETVGLSIECFSGGGVSYAWWSKVLVYCA
jgi:hypothetical protein